MDVPYILRNLILVENHPHQPKQEFKRQIPREPRCMHTKKIEEIYTFTLSNTCGGGLKLNMSYNLYYILYLIVLFFKKPAIYLIFPEKEIYSNGLFLHNFYYRIHFILFCCLCRFVVDDVVIVMKRVCYMVLHYLTS